MAPKPLKTQVRTHPNKQRTDSLHEQKCAVRTRFLAGPYPNFLSCKPAFKASMDVIVSEYCYLRRIVISYTYHRILQRRFSSLLQRSFQGEASCPPIVAAQIIKIVGEEIAAENRPIKEKVSVAAADRIIVEHADLFSDSGYEKNFHVSLETLPSVVFEMGDLIFKEKKHLGTVAAFLAFGATFAAYCEQKEGLGQPAVEAIVTSVVDYLNCHLLTWLRSNGGVFMLRAACEEGVVHCTAAVRRKLEFADLLLRKGVRKQQVLAVDNAQSSIAVCKLALETQKSVCAVDGRASDYGKVYFEQRCSSEALDALGEVANMLDKLWHSDSTQLNSTQLHREIKDLLFVASDVQNQFIFDKKTYQKTTAILTMFENLLRELEALEPTVAKGTSNLFDGTENSRNVDSDSCTFKQPEVYGEGKVPPEILARGPSAIEAYNKALVEGKTRVKRVPVMLIGQDRSGKTSIKKSLMGKPFDPEEGSTVGVDMDPSYFEVSTEIWKTKQENEGANSDPAISYEHNLARMVVGSLQKEREALKDINDELLTVPTEGTVSLAGHEPDIGSSDVSTTKKSHSEATEASSDVEGAPERNLDLHVPDDVVPPSSSQDDSPDDAGSDQSACSQDDNLPLIVPEEVPEDVATLITELLKDVDKMEDEEEVYSVLWDFGGQSVYYATHPLFLTSRAIYLLAYNLNRNLEDPAIPVTKQGMYKKVHDTYCGKTNIDYLNFWLSSIASLARSDEANPESCDSKKLPKRLPPVLLVCTHAHGDADSRRQALEIFGSLKTKPYNNHLFEDVFALDNTKSGSGQECSEVMRLRKEIRDVAKDLPQMKEEIPLKWLKFERALRVLSEEGHKWIPLDQARQVAFQVCKIVSDEEFSTLLNFLHDQRILMHFSDTPKLNKMVILNLNWLIDVFKKVITVKPYDPKEKEFTELWDKLEKTGILEGKLLKHVWGPLFEQQETVEGLIAIMEKFSLLCPWPFSNGSQQYLVPSMLMSLPTDKVLNLLASAPVASLFVKFDSGQVPQGLFPRLVLQLFQLFQSQPQLFHNFARFYTRSDGGCSVMLLCHATSIEIVVHGGSPVRHHSDDLVENIQSKMTLNEEFRHDTSDVITCHSVRRQLELVLNCMREEFSWLKQMKFEMCVCCTVCCHSGSVKYCRTHHKEGCKQEECLHFLSESELRNCQQPIFCCNSAVAGDNKVQVQQFAPWFPFLDEQKKAGDERDGRRFLAAAGHDEQFALALPSGVLETLQSKTSNAKDVVVQLQECLQLDRAALEQPKPETKQLIRCLAKKAKCANRLDVVKHLRTITPAGTTGPLLPEHHDVRNIPFGQRKDLTINLCGGDEWKVVAESLGLTAAEIRYLDNRTLNPCDAALAHIGNKYYTSVGNVYDVLVDCQMPQYADLL